METVKPEIRWRYTYNSHRCEGTDCQGLGTWQELRYGDNIHSSENSFVYVLVSLCLLKRTDGHTSCGKGVNRSILSQG